MKRTLIAGIAAAVALAVPAAALAAGAFEPAPAAATAVALTIKSDTQHAKKDAKGAWHDAYLPAAFGVTAGQKATVTVTNWDDAPHTFTAPKLGLSVLIPGARNGKPSVTTFSFTAKKAGAYDWWCAAGCDPWAMSRLGFMRGRITVSE